MWNPKTQDDFSVDQKKKTAWKDIFLQKFDV